MNFTISQAIWGDVFVAGNGRIGCVYDLGIDVIVDFMAIEGGILKKKDSMIFNFTEKVLFARGDKNNLGHILVMGQGQASGKFRLKSSGGNYDPPTTLTTAATQVCDLVPIDNSFRYAVQISPTMYYDSATQRTHVIPNLPQGTSQGIIQIYGTEIRWSDIWRAVVPQMGYPFQVDDVFIGEGATDPHHIQALEGSTQKNIWWGTADRPRAAYDANHNIFATASRGPAGVTFNFFNRPLPDLGIIPNPNPEPEPEPEPEPNLGNLPAKVQATLTKFYDAKCPKDDDGDVILPQGEEPIRSLVIKAAEQVAWEHPNEGWGTKRADPGRPVSSDTVSQKTGNKLVTWDYITDAGGPNGELKIETCQGEDITGQVYIGPGGDLGGGKKFTPQNHLDDVIPGPDPEPEPEPEPCNCTPVVPGHNEIAASLNSLRSFCQNYIAPANALPEYANTKPYVNDEIHDGGLYLADGLLYFMLSDTGNWAKILMNPEDKRSWDAKRADADAALQTYMRRRVGDNS